MFYFLLNILSLHIISSSSGKALHLTQNQEFTKTDLSKEDVNNGKAFYGELINELAVLSSPRSRADHKPVYIKLAESQNFIKANNSKCIIQGVASPGIKKSDTINIEFNEVTCEVNGIIENHEIDGHIRNIVAETVPV